MNDFWRKIMPKNYLVTKKLKDMPQEKAYDQDKDLKATLHDIVDKMKDEANKAMYNDWDVSPKDLKHCDIKVFGSNPTKVTLKVTQQSGAYRLPKMNPRDVQQEANNTLKVLKKFEAALKKEFKKRTGKTLRISSGETNVNWGLVALNGLHQFVAIKEADVKTELEGQSWEKE